MLVSAKHQHTWESFLSYLLLAELGLRGRVGLSPAAVHGLLASLVVERVLGAQASVAVERGRSSCSSRA